MGVFVKTGSWLRPMRRLFGGYLMMPLQSQLPQKHSEWHRALQLLAGNPHRTTEDMLVFGDVFSSNILEMLVVAGLATAVTETLSAGRARLSGC
jgi:hypothetical protein